MGKKKNLFFVMKQTKDKIKDQPDSQEARVAEE